MLGALQCDDNQQGQHFFLQPSRILLREAKLNRYFFSDIGIIPVAVTRSTRPGWCPYLKTSNVDVSVLPIQTKNSVHGMHLVTGKVRREA